MLRLVCLFGVLLAGVGTAATAAPPLEPTDDALKRRFTDVVQPFLKTHCIACHGEKKQEAKLDLSRFSTVAMVVKNHRVWDTVLERLELEEMPPEKAPKQPTAHERAAVIEWLKALREDNLSRNAGDPGPILPRRLSNAEFDYTIHDLTGVDMRPAREFPVDPANEAGFDNSGESLTMSPALMKKHLAAARSIADHLVLKPHGFVFAPHSAVTETDRDKYCVQRIIAFYNRQPIDCADYFLAAWRFQHRAALGRPHAALTDFATQAGISGKYLGTIWSTLAAAEPSAGLLGQVRTAWRKLPVPGDQNDSEALETARRDCGVLSDLVVRLRKELEPRVEKMHAPGISDGSQPFVLWRNREVAANRMRYVKKNGIDEAEDPAFAHFCVVFPDAFFMADRGAYFDPKGAGQGRLLTAGFHLMQGYFRDDEPLRELILDEDGQRELDALWRELDFITLVPMRQYKDFIFFERAESPRYMQEAAFDFARSEDKDSISTEKIEQLRVAYLAKARRIDCHAEGLRAIETYFANISAAIRWVEEAHLAAEPSHLDALAKFAERAYRRPLLPAEREDLLAFYRSLRDRGELSHEDAIRDSVASVILSPHFSYRVDLAQAGESARPLSDYALASRLSYFLWSSMPDEELLAHAAAGNLHEPKVLIAQANRMLGDERVERLAVEFSGNWLDFRRFEEHNAVDRERFADFTNELRQAMYEEPLRFFVDVIRRDGSLLDFLYADH
ncbi:MAG TPA: DUF1592 domain-containing protein, partial [Planctomycetaceae bacterium]|nr:DUF1592 domain-containing protein [Planctomycetaceae bacterium]